MWEEDDEEEKMTRGDCFHIVFLPQLSLRYKLEMSQAPNTFLKACQSLLTIAVSFSITK